MVACRFVLSIPGECPSPSAQGGMGTYLVASSLEQLGDIGSLGTFLAWIFSGRGDHQQLLLSIRPEKARHLW